MHTVYTAYSVTGGYYNVYYAVLCFTTKQRQLPIVLSGLAFTTGQALRVTMKAVLHLMLCSCGIAFLLRQCRAHNELPHTFRAKLLVV